MKPTNPSLAVVILAAGQGTRMNSDLPKVLHRLDSRPLVEHVIETAQKFNPDEIVLVIGHKAEEVKQAIGGSVSYALQAEQLGTGHAVAQARPLLAEHEGQVLILYGDMPLLTYSTLHSLVSLQATTPAPLTMLTVISDNPRGFGRIVRSENGAVTAIVEEADCTPEQLAIKELNVGVYCIQATWLWDNLDNIEVSAKGEYYLTDLVAIAVQQGHAINVVTSADLVETMGINTPEHLAEAEAALKARSL